MHTYSLHFLFVSSLLSIGLLGGEVEPEAGSMRFLRGSLGGSGEEGSIAGLVLERHRHERQE